MSRRIGLRTIPVTAAVVNCHVGEEQFTNGGVETGDFTGWTMSGDIYVETTDGIVPYEGSYYARCFTCVDPTGEMSQDLANQIPTACFGDTSVFQVACIGRYSPSPPQGSVITITIVYSDDTETQVQWEATEDMVWDLVNLKPYLEAGKKVKGIRINFTTPTGFCGVDAISCIP